MEDDIKLELLIHISPGLSQIFGAKEEYKWRPMYPMSKYLKDINQAN